jgi:hypothetical protein
MKKFLLLLVAVVLAGGLVLSCAQPSSFEVTLAPGSAEAVSTEAIKYDVLPGYNLVQWDGANDGSSYQIYRKTVDADNNPVDASILYLGSGYQTATLQLWFYADQAVKDGEKYQYGIVTVSYKDSGNDVVVKSEISWQAETDAVKYAAANKPAPGTKYQVPATPPTVTITPINSSTPGVAIPAGQADTADRILITVSGLDLNYKYGLSRQVSGTGAEVNYGADGGSLFPSGDIWSYNYNPADPQDNVDFRRISNFLENGTTLSMVVPSGWTGGLLSTTDPTTRRLVIEYDTAVQGGVLEFTEANNLVSPLSSKEKAVGAIPRS